jgi:hypothetical protein
LEDFQKEIFQKSFMLSERHLKRDILPHGPSRCTATEKQEELYLLTSANMLSQVALKRQSDHERLQLLLNLGTTGCDYGSDAESNVSATLEYQ